MSDISNVFYLHLNQATPKRANSLGHAQTTTPIKKKPTWLTFLRCTTTLKKSGLHREQVLKNRLRNAIQEREHLTQCIATSDQTMA